MRRLAPSVKHGGQRRRCPIRSARGHDARGEVAAGPADWDRRDGGRLRGVAPQRRRGRDRDSLHAQYARRADARTRFLREAYIANKAGRGAVTVKDDDVDDEGAPYLVMELLHGEPVDARAKRLGAACRSARCGGSRFRCSRRSSTRTSVASSTATSSPTTCAGRPSGAVKVLDFGVARRASRARPRRRAPAGWSSARPRT